MSIFRSVSAMVRRRFGGRNDGDAASRPRTGENGATADIAEFFLRPENSHLYACCPFRLDLATMDGSDEGTRGRLRSHMLGHLLDFRCLDATIDPGGPTPSAIYDRSVDEGMRRIYNDLNNRLLNEARRAEWQPLELVDPKFKDYGPEQRGCFGHHAETELAAEALRAYITNPNYIKSVAPEVAERIRDIVNVNPLLNKTIMFN